jgi:hypothetical protein
MSKHVPVRAARRVRAVVLLGVYVSSVVLLRVQCRSELGFRFRL